MLNYSGPKIDLGSTKNCISSGAVGTDLCPFFTFS